MYHMFLIHSSVDGHLGCLHVLWVAVFYLGFLLLWSSLKIGQNFPTLFHILICFCFHLGEIHINKINLLKANNSGAFTALTMLCTHNHHLCPVPKHFHHPKRKPGTQTYAPIPSPPPLPGNHQSAFCLCRFTYSGYFI